jgi:hypothetical protein
LVRADCVPLCILDAEVFERERAGIDILTLLGADFVALRVLTTDLRRKDHRLGIGVDIVALCIPPQTMFGCRCKSTKGASEWDCNGTHGDTTCSKLLTLLSAHLVALGILTAHLEETSLNVNLAFVVVLIVLADHTSVDADFAFDCLRLWVDH